ncbi:MAG: glycerophosphodiester phosphodiesterase [Candidatus Electryoneaceae bacterium]|nr:glycerophosphodiester phosphodiesterase [Candidatus Electryoneaceae bacterium]
MFSSLDTNFFLIAHRGGRYYRPENILSAFQYSVDSGIEWIECDVRLSKDNVPILHHDDRISVPGVGWKAVREMPYSQIRTIDIGGGEYVPTLYELLERFKGQLCFDLELKEIDTAPDVVSYVKLFDITEQVIITSFIPEALQSVGDMLPNVPKGLLIDRLTGNLTGGRSAVKAARLLGCQYILPHYRLIGNDWIKAAGSEGLKILSWTVNHLSDARRLLNMGVDGLISDRPNHILPLTGGLK